LRKTGGQLDERGHRLPPCNHRKSHRTPEQAHMPLLYAPYVPSLWEDFILRNRRILADQMEFLIAHVPKSSMRSAFTLLDKQAEVFNHAFQVALHSAIDEEVRLMLPQVGAGHAPQSAPVDSSDDLSLVDFGEVERILLLDRVAQRFTSRYEAGIGPLTLRLGVLLGQDASLLPCNPFRAEVFVRAFLTAWEKCDLDARATEDLMLSLEPQHWIDLEPLYDDLNATLEHVGIQAQVVHRIRRSPGAASSFSTLGSASTPAALEGGESIQSGTGSGMSTLAPTTSSSVWGGLAPAGRSIAAHARQFLKKLGIARPAAEHQDDAGQALAWTPSDEQAGPAPHAAADPEFMGFLGDLQAGASASEKVRAGQEPQDHNILRRLRDSDEVRRAPDLDRGTVDAWRKCLTLCLPTRPFPCK
jgi:hypothetical protein